MAQLPFALIIVLHKKINSTLIAKYLQKFILFMKNNNNKHLYISMKSNEKTLIELNYSCIIMLTNKNFSRLFKVFNYYSKRIFVCDFENQDYFWLDSQYLNNIHNNEYN